MTWYRTGTIAVTNGSAAVTGSGTDFVQNVLPGEALQGPDGRTYEVLAVVSATQLTLASNYLGSTASAQAYAVIPTQSFALALAQQAAALIASFATVRDGVGQGLFPDGTVTTPAIRFATDQDTGIYRKAPGVIGFGNNGVESMYLDSDNNMLIGGDDWTGGFARVSAKSTDALSRTFSAWHAAPSGSAMLSRVDNSAAALHNYYYGSTLTGSVTTNGTATSFNTTSDARLKSAIIPATEDPGAMIDQIAIVQYDWTASGEHVRWGGTTQQMRAVFPEAVNVPADPDEMQSVDWSKFVPALIAEVQALRTRLAALEGAAA